MHLIRIRQAFLQVREYSMHQSDVIDNAGIDDRYSMGISGSPLPNRQLYSSHKLSKTLSRLSDIADADTPSSPPDEYDSADQLGGELLSPSSVQLLVLDYVLFHHLIL